MPRSAESSILFAIWLPDRWKLVRRKAWRLFRSGDRNGAIELCESYAKAHPEMPEASGTLAELVLASKRREEAERVLRTSVAEHPETGLTRYMLAKLLLDDGRLDEAESAYRALARDWQDGPYVCLGLARLARSRDDPSEAQQYAARAGRSLPPRDASSLGLAALILASCPGGERDARRAIRRALGLFGYRARRVPRRQRALLCLMLGVFEERTHPRRSRRDMAAARRLWLNDDQKSFVSAGREGTASRP